MASTILGLLLAEQERQRLGLTYVDPFWFIVEIDAARGNPDAVALLRTKYPDRA